MRITGPNATARTTTPASVRRASSGTFSVGEQEAPRNAVSAGALRAVTGLDALIALQGVDQPLGFFEVDLRFAAFSHDRLR